MYFLVEVVAAMPELPTGLLAISESQMTSISEFYVILFGTNEKCIKFFSG